MSCGKENFRHKVKQAQERDALCVACSRTRGVDAVDATTSPVCWTWKQMMLPPALYVGHGFGIIPSVLQSFFGSPLFCYPLVFAFGMEVFNLGRCML